MCSLGSSNLHVCELPAKVFCVNSSLLYISFTILVIVFQEMEDKVISPEKVEEAKLKARYPHLGQKPGGSDFLRKRLQKGVSSLLSAGYGQEIPYKMPVSVIIPPPPPLCE